MNEIKIRKVRKADLTEVVDISIRGWQTAYRGIIDDDFLDSMDKQEMLKRQLEDYQKDGFIVAELEEKVVGFCRYIDSNEKTPDIEGIDCEICALYVKPELKRHGIGKAMFKYVTNEFKIKEKKKMIIWCLKENEPSRKFYKIMGGIEIPQEHFYEKAGKKYQEAGYVYDLTQ